MARHVVFTRPWAPGQIHTCEYFEACLRRDPNIRGSDFDMGDDPPLYAVRCISERAMELADASDASRAVDALRELMLVAVRHGGRDLTGGLRFAPEVEMVREYLKLRLPLARRPVREGEWVERRCAGGDIARTRTLPNPES